MLNKVFARSFILVVMLISTFAIPAGVLAGGVCGGIYIVDPGDTFNIIAAKCGTSVSAITAANPGVREPLYTGQTLTVPGSNYNSSIPTPPPVYYDPPAYYPPAYYQPAYYPPSSYNPYIPVNYNGIYYVQPGDTFSVIAVRYGVSMNALWMANPNIPNINLLYIGQPINVPTSGYVVTPTPEPSVPLSYGSVPYGAPYGKVKLINRANGDVYVSLQGTTTDGTSVINEYPVDGSMKVKIPAASYGYVAWVGGIKFEGSFHLGGDGDRTITFYANKVVVE